MVIAFRKNTPRGLFKERTAPAGFWFSERGVAAASNPSTEIVTETLDLPGNTHQQRHMLPGQSDPVWTGIYVLILYMHILAVEDICTHLDPSVKGSKRYLLAKRVHLDLPEQIVRKNEVCTHDFHGS